MRLMSHENVVVAAILCAVLAGCSEQRSPRDITAPGTMSGLVMARDSKTAGEPSLRSEAEVKATLPLPPIAIEQSLSIGAEAFFPGSSAKYSNTYGTGGAYFTEAVNGALVAHVHLPHKAVVREFTVHFRDNSAKDLTVYFHGLKLKEGSFRLLASLTSTGIVGYGSRSTTSIADNVIDNTSLGYLIYVWCQPWDSSGNLRIMGATIRYRLQ